MLKKLILIFALVMMLTGCRRADDIYLEAVDTNAPVEEESSDTLDKEETQTVTEDSMEVKEPEPETIIVYVCGAVVNPGVYELCGDDRIDDAVQAAGGFSEDADTSYVNLAARLSDGIRLYIPTMEETEKSAATNGAIELATYDSGDTSGSALTGSNASSSKDTEGKLININSASKEELTALPGIGEVTAEKIVRYRDENGRFSKIEDIMKVSGIKDKLFSKIKEYITV